MSDNIEIKKSRLVFIYFCIMALFLVIILRMIFVVCFGDKITVSRLYDLNKKDKRADIFDRNDVLVATDLKTKSLYISSVLIKDQEKIAQGLVKIFPDFSYAEILKKISEEKNSRQWILIRRNLTPHQVSQVQNMQLAGLLFEDDLIRVYPQKAIASHFVGYVDLDRKGLAGMEMQYDRKLRKGENLHLTLDIRIQDILHYELLKAMEEYNARAAAGLVMNVNNGEILALSSLPEFDPNLQSDASPNQRFNRVTNGVYELGSVFKVLTNAAAFEKNLVKIDDIYNVSEPIKYGRFTINDYHKIKDEMTVGEIFSHSSNVGTVKIADKLGADNQKDFLAKLGLLKKIDADFPGMGRPIFPRLWREINLYTISYGYGISITPLHLAMAVSAIVNGGILYYPSFVKTEVQPEGQRVIKESTSKIMRQMLREAVTGGTGKKANIEGYEVGGKTGTAELAESGSYNERQTMVSFIAAFPISQPQYLVYIILDRPNHIFNTGGMVAAPVAGKIINNIAPLLQIKPGPKVKFAISSETVSNTKSNL
jgi:cell division protein FtsI (penicillin-binding protein 3)